ncbi:serine hydrolase domain-containing protein [Autumnicola edwardsiae]|uniref:Serine hydrolase domain-containing protein n=1 Tax=Autumnicola edwardsiae TaxID=3075594 RepID=A0ABU3CZC5_9FLAO|nr:serine hydrolase domain-containing protein [Zunongwangia sp. F297]MDT0651613.1 serine hydrolase domain-containing protein [Zunongwangia sp. F297]
MKKLIITSLLLFISAICLSQNLNTKKLDSLFQLLEQHNKFMGTLVVSQDQKTIYSNSIGFADVENKIKADSLTKYRIGSISKMFTATLILNAVEEGKLELDQPIGKYFPKIDNSHQITIKNLLNHSSGIHDFTRNEDYFSWNTSFQSKEDMLKKISNFKNDFEPSSKSQYSNSNFVLLTFILEDIYKQSFQKILNQKIVKPLHLNNTYYGKKISSENNEAYSYKFLGEWKKEKETDMSIPKGAGGIVSNPKDLKTFIEQLFIGNIISDKSLNLMKNIENGYGLGMLQFPYNDKISYGHTGGIDGFESVVSYFPEDKLTISLSSNGVNYNKNNILLAVLATFYNNSYDLPNFETIELTSEDLEKYLGTYSSDQIPLKITCTKQGNTLITQATGQKAFPLEATVEDIFTYEQAGITLEFNPTENEVTLKQGGGEFLFKKE